MKPLYRVEHNVAPATALRAVWTLYKGVLTKDAADDLCITKRLTGGYWRVTPEAGE